MRRTILGTTLVALTVTLGTGGATAAAAHDRQGPRAPGWGTTVGSAGVLHERMPGPFREASSPGPPVFIGGRQTFQPMDGFGASTTDSSAALLYPLGPAARDDAIRALFSPAAGIGVSFLRQPVGSSDFTAAARHYTY